MPYVSKCAKFRNDVKLFILSVLGFRTMPKSNTPGHVISGDCFFDPKLFVQFPKCVVPKSAPIVYKVLPSRLMWPTHALSFLAHVRARWTAGQGSASCPPSRPGPHSVPARCPPMPWPAASLLLWAVVLLAAIGDGVGLLFVSLPEEVLGGCDAALAKPKRQLAVIFCLFFNLVGEVLRVTLGGQGI